jgi:isopenicillin-N epimerase
MDTLSAVPNVELVSPMDKNLSCAIASFRVKDKISSDIADQLYKDHGILTVSRSLGKQGCVRVTPAIYNSADEINKFTAAVKAIANSS